MIKGTEYHFKGFCFNDKLLLVYRHKNGIDIRTAKVFDMNYRDNGLITYCAWYPATHTAGYQPSGSGAFDPDNVKKGNFGLIDVINLTSEERI